MARHLHLCLSVEQMKVLGTPDHVHASNQLPQIRRLGILCPVCGDEFALPGDSIIVEIEADVEEAALHVESVEILRWGAFPGQVAKVWGDETAAIEDFGAFFGFCEDQIVGVVEVDVGIQPGQGAY